MVRNNNRSPRSRGMAWIALVMCLVASTITKVHGSDGKNRNSFDLAAEK